MITLLESAHKELDAYFSDKEKASIRIYLAPGGCSGPRLALALDEAGEADKTAEAGGYTFVMNTDLHQQVGNVTIDVTCSGFTLTPQIPLPGGGGCGGCGSSSNCCG
ncbi:IscA/HesB family protein [Oleidesulfovibrio sp.]|uniref:IscA/HesB family protein n=1 Tax=Oleidesulfovibrio sp. TaxID=2909707 RepID=UPI003A8B0485